MINEPRNLNGIQRLQYRGFWWMDHSWRPMWPEIFEDPCLRPVLETVFTVNKGFNWDIPFD